MINCIENKSSTSLENLVHQHKDIRKHSVMQKVHHKSQQKQSNSLSATKRLERLGAYNFTIKDINDDKQQVNYYLDINQSSLRRSSMKTESINENKLNISPENYRNEIVLLRKIKKRNPFINQTQLKGFKKQICSKKDLTQIIHNKMSSNTNQIVLLKQLRVKSQQKTKGRASLVEKTRINNASRSKQMQFQERINKLINSRYATEQAYRQKGKYKGKNEKDLFKKTLQKMEQHAITKDIKQQIQFILNKNYMFKSKISKRLKTKIIQSHNTSIRKSQNLQIIDQQQPKTNIMMPYIHVEKMQRLNQSAQDTKKYKQFLVAQNNIIKQPNKLGNSNGIRKISIKKNYKKDGYRSYHDFIDQCDDLSIYDQKIKSYRELIFIINIAHRIFDPLIIVDQTFLNSMEKQAIPKYLYYIGKGNNSNLIKSLMKKRIWWAQTSISSEANFVWSQLMISAVVENQENCQTILSQNFQNNIETKGSKIRYKQKTSNDKTKNLLKSSNFAHNNKISNKYQIYKPAYEFLEDKKLLIQSDSLFYRSMLNSLRTNQFDSFQKRLKYLPNGYLSLKNNNVKQTIHNHFYYNHYLGNKKSLFYFLTFYYQLIDEPIQSVIPKTFHVKSMDNDLQYQEFLSYFYGNKEKNMNLWIVKPGQNSNRGSGIHVISTIKTLNKIMREDKKSKKKETTFIIQKYIQRPLLYKGRKFDLRHYMVITGLYGHLRAYWYGQGYVRTSSNMFSLQQIDDPLTHLTNDAIQKQSATYGKFQQANKISYNELQNYFSKNYPNKNFDLVQIYKRMREIATKSVQSVYLALSKSRKLHSFQIFGLDFMIEDDLSVKLIQINTNPCLQLSCNLLGRVIPLMIEQSLRISIDVVYPQNIHYNNTLRSQAPDCTLDKLNFELIFDQLRDGRRIKQLYQDNMEQFNKIAQKIQSNRYDEQDIYENEGYQVQINTFQI